MFNELKKRLVKIEILGYFDSVVKICVIIDVSLVGFGVILV